MTITLTKGRKAALAAIAGVATATTMLAPATAGAAPVDGAKRADVGYLALTPFGGSLDANPVASYQATKACPAADRAYALVALAKLDGTFIDSLSSGFTPTATPPKGQLDAGSLTSQVRAHGLASGYYRTDLLCYNDDFGQAVVADVNVIKIDTAKNRFSVFPFPAQRAAAAR